MSTEELLKQLEFSEKMRAAAKSFHDVAVKERDYERERCDRLSDENKKLKSRIAELEAELEKKRSPTMK